MWRLETTPCWPTLIGHEAAMLLILEHWAGVNAKTAFGEMTLYWAARDGH
jgi:hypothetical protein